MRISLRELEEKDAELMLEWMHDEQIQKAFKRDMLGITLEEARAFCCNAHINQPIALGDDIHYAIVDEKDEYLGTISLKDIDSKNGTAEYAIVTRREAWRRGIASAATKLILEKAFEECGLHRVFLSVMANNEAAIRMYESNGFILEGVFREHLVCDGERVDWRWYGILRDEYETLKNNGWEKV